MKYTTPQAFERALSDRLKRQAAEVGVDLDRLRKRVAFERFLARLFSLYPPSTPIDLPSRGLLTA